MTVKYSTRVLLLYPIVLFFLILAFYGQASAQSYPYQEIWKKIEEQELDGLLKNTLPLVDEIYNQAKKENQPQQKIKALLYQSKITLITQDDKNQETELLARFRSEISKAEPIEKSILQSLLAGLLYEYYQNNRYRLANRTRLEEALATDNFLTWTSVSFQKEITDLYNASLSQSAQLINESVEDWMFILDTAIQYRELRPTVYDLLVHRALDYFTTNNYYEKADNLIRSLLDQHQNNLNKNAYLYNRLVSSNLKRKSDTEQIEELKALAKLYPDAWYTSEILLQLATSYQRHFYKVNTSDNKRQYMDSVLAIGRLMDNSYSKARANLQLKSTIIEPMLAPEMNIQSERYNISEQAIPVFVSHKNINKLYIKVLSYKKPSSNYMNSDFNVQENVKSQADIDSLIELYPTVQSYSRNLKDFNDYQYHSTIVKFDALNNGEYLALISNNESFKLDSNNVVAFQTFRVSNNALVIRDDELLLTDRESGKPLKNVEIGIYTPSENLLNLKLIQNVVTDENGIAKIGKQLYLRNKKIRKRIYQVKSDIVFFQTNYNFSVRNNLEQEEKKVQFFIDRGIYRPGQTVYFKGIIYKEKGENRQVLVNSKTTVKLYDPYYGEIDSLELTSNQYGSVFGSFVLPQEKLKGNFYIQANRDQNRKGFRVEEYKRPAFQVVMDTIKGTFKIGQEIVAKGRVQAFSDAAINQAKVKYHVIRKSRFPYSFWRGINSNNDFAFEEVSVGETTTDKAGRFEVKFFAKPAQEKKENFRFYNYEVKISATDINGETHEGSQTISVGDKSIVLTIPIQEKENLDFLDSIPIRTTNLNGQLVNASGNIRLIKLKAPSRILRPFGPRTVDYMLEDSLEFIKQFSHLPYGNEHLVENWPKEKLVFNEDFHSAKQHAVSLNKTNRWEEGAYLLEAYVLDGQDTLRTSRLLRLYRSESKRPVDKELLRVSLVKPSYKPGENAEIVFSSAASNAVIFLELEQGGKIIKREQLILNRNVRKVVYPISQNVTDQIFVHYYMGKYNTIENGIITIPIVKPTTDLTITTSTFRDKLQPGQEETWELKISGADKDKLFPEVLALMYDASLDKFAQNQLFFPRRSTNTYSKIDRWNTSSSYSVVYGGILSYRSRHINRFLARYEDLEYFGFSFINPSGKQKSYVNKLSGKTENIDQIFTSAGDLNEITIAAYGTAKRRDLTGSVAGQQIMIRSASTDSKDEGKTPRYVIDGVMMEEAVSTLKPEDIQSIEILNGASATAIYGAIGMNGVVFITTKTAAAEAEVLKMIPVRKDLKETAFFYPDLRTDEEGNVKIQFTTPESLTEWKFTAFAHTIDLQMGYLEKTVRTSKDLMVVPNAPRFLRAGDELVLSTKVINLSGGPLTGSAKLMFFDAITMQPLDSLFALSIVAKKFNIEKGESTNVSWQFKVPELQQAVTYRIVAAAGNFTDGEESVLPILPNKQLVTETMSLYVKEGQKKQFTLSNLANSHNPDHVRLTLEIASNPIWYAIQALPYLHESSYQSSEQLFARLYSALVSKHLVDVSPVIKTIFDDWNKKTKLQSRLETNEELKMLLMEETPWVREAENEETRMKRLALLFDLNNFRQQYGSTLQKLKGTQLHSGAFPWFEGGNASENITTHILAGFGHLKALRINNLDSTDSSYQQIINKAISYLDKNARENLKPQGVKRSTLGYNDLFYLYARSYFVEEQPVNDTIIATIFRKLEGSGYTHNLQSKAMLALVYKRFGKQKKASALVKSLKDYAVQSDEMGMYWKENVSGWNWWQSPIETQALLIEAFQEVTHDEESVGQMKVWLLKNKQTNHWASTKATTEAIYSLLLNGKDWLATEAGVEVKVGEEFVDMKNKTSAAGYIKTSWNKSEIKPEMAQVEITKTSPGIVWGGLYWQYFQNLDKIKASSNGVQLEKALFIKKNTEKGPALNPITNDTPIQVGDIITVRLVIRADRDLQFMHLKDMRASGFEPINVLSAYKWQDGLGFYESTGDAATNFFIDRIPKGTYVFEYDLRANNAGSFSNGITTLQSMYAPEMSAHSEGIQVKITQTEP